MVGSGKDWAKGLWWEERELWNLALMSSETRKKI
jgi:hypothetical protein